MPVGYKILCILLGIVLAISLLVTYFSYHASQEKFTLVCYAGEKVVLDIEAQGVESYQGTTYYTLDGKRHKFTGTCYAIPKK
jgi:hypothetical protein